MHALMSRGHIVVVHQVVLIQLLDVAKHQLRSPVDAQASC